MVVLIIRRQDFVKEGIESYSSIKNNRAQGQESTVVHKSRTAALRSQSMAILGFPGNSPFCCASTSKKSLRNEVTSQFTLA